MLKIGLSKSQVGQIAEVQNYEIMFMVTYFRLMAHTERHPQLRSQF